MKTVLTAVVAVVVTAAVGLASPTAKAADVLSKGMVLGGGKAVEFTVPLEGGVKNVVAVKGDGDTILDVEIRDASGRLLASDSIVNDTLVFTVRPTWDTRVTVTVINRGLLPNEVLIGRAAE